MAPPITHLVIGERVFAQLQRFDDEEYGPFLLGCVLVDLPVPIDVIYTAFEVPSSGMHVDFAATIFALNVALIPNVLTHVPHDAFQTMWDIIKGYVISDGSLESYIEALGRRGRTSVEIQEIVHQHDVYLEDAQALVQDIGGIKPHIQAGVQRSLATIPRLWV